MDFCLCLDLGSEQDYAAFGILQHFPRFQEKPGISYNSHRFQDTPSTIVNELHLRYLERLPLKTPYPVIVEGIHKIMNRPEFVGNIALVVDQTGVGLPVIQMMRQTPYCMAPIGVTIHGGAQENAREDGGYSVPKRDLAMSLVSAYQMRRLRMPSKEKLPAVGDLVRELKGFKMKMNEQTGHDSYEAWLERIHDDLVMAVGLGVWYMTKIHGGSVVTQPGNLPH